jgi:hypothetical protein
VLWKSSYEAVNPIAAKPQFNGDGERRNLREKISVVISPPLPVTS